MSPSAIDHPDQIRWQWQGWSCSVLFHSVTAIGAAALLSTLRIELPPDQFTWNVAMVEPAKTQPQVDPQPQTKPTPMPPKPKEMTAQPPAPQPVVHQIQQMVSRQVVQRQVTQATSTVTPVNQTASTIISQSVQRSEASKTITPAATRETAIQEKSAVIQQTLTSQPEITVATEAPVTRQDPAPIVRQTAVEAASDPIAKTQPLASREPAEPIAQAPQAAVQQTVAYAPQAKSLPATKADYGWLMKTLLGRVNDLKHYPVTARLNHWEGKVVLKAVITEDGNVLTVEIHESSGRPILDNDAVETLRKASPIKLEHPLGKPQVAILMPISYSLR